MEIITIPLYWTIMKTPIEAYEFTLQKIEDLQEEHPEIDVKIVPSKSRNNAELREKYIQHQRIPTEKWVHVTFRFPNDNYWYILAELRNYLGQCGISFDTGGMKGYRDWELDWSFRYTGEDNLTGGMQQMK